MESPRKMPCILQQTARSMSSQQRSAARRGPRLRFDKLTAEIIALIFRELRHIDLVSALQSRLVCRRFDELGTPICYSEIALTSSIVDGAERYPRLLDHISLHAKHVTVPSTLDPVRVRAILGSVQHVSSITVEYIRGSSSPFSLLNLDTMRADTKLTIQNLPLASSRAEYDIPLPSALAQHLVSIQLVSPAPPLTTKTDSLKDLLVRCGALHTLSYEDVGRGTRFSFASGERMPALTTLILRSYDWDHSPDTVRRHWDFSRLQHLALSSVPVYSFLRSLGHSDLCGLSTLRVHDGAYVTTDSRQEATQGLYLLLKSRIRALRVLDLQCDTRIFGHDAITRHGETLEELRFRHHGQDATPTLTVDQLHHLSRGLPQLRKLELDVGSACDPDFLRTLCSFPRLQHLVLHTHTLLQPYDTVDRDLQAAEATFDKLIAAREGLYPDITLNVGGWWPGMQRKRKANGLCSQRCFALRDGRVYENFTT